MANDFEQIQNLPGFNAPNPNADPSRWQNPGMSALQVSRSCQLSGPEGFGAFFQRFTKDTAFQADRVSENFRIVTRTGKTPTPTDPGLDVQQFKKSQFERFRAVLNPLLQSPQGARAYAVSQTVNDAEIVAQDGRLHRYRFLLLGNCWTLAVVDR